MPTAFDDLIPYDPSAISVPSNVAARWETDLLAQRAYILSALNSKVPDAATFQKVIATPSSTRFSAFLLSVGSGFDASAIVSKQNAKLSASATQWLTDVNAAFQSGGSFDTNVALKSSKFLNAVYTIAAVGYTPTLAWGPAAKIVLLLNGDTRPLAYPLTGEVISGTPVNVFDPDFVRGPRAFILREVVRSLVVGQYFINAGQSGTPLSTWQTAENAKLTKMVNALLATKYQASGYSVTLETTYNGTTGKQQVHGNITTP